MPRGGASGCPAASSADRRRPKVTPPKDCYIQIYCAPSERAQAVPIIAKTGFGLKEDACLKLRFLYDKSDTRL
jgi:hypothetical protein